jgi:formylglycine-generating enzyme required for sulfatase activity
MRTSRLLLAGLTLITCLAGSAHSHSQQQANESSSSSEFGATITNNSVAPKPAPAEMVWIPGGEFSMGASTNGHGTDEMPMASNDA